MLSFINKIKFSLISLVLLITTVFIGNVGHIIFSIFMTILVAAAEIYTWYTIGKMKKKSEEEVSKAKEEAAEMYKVTKMNMNGNVQCYRKGGCGPYEMRSCNECSASKPEYAERYNKKA